ncbi:MAG: hypothetical protein WC975_06000 [Phycisphaerae bacterium]
MKQYSMDLRERIVAARPEGRLRGRVSCSLQAVANAVKRLDIGTRPR